jgi:predicted nucleotidyltransferase
MTKPSVPAELLKSVVAQFAPQRVFLFGSAARGEAGPGLVDAVLDDVRALAAGVREARR